MIAYCLLLSCCVSERTGNPLQILTAFILRRTGCKLFINMSLCRQNYHEESEAGVNKQINLELYASYVYQSMVSEFFIFGSDLIQSIHIIYHVH